MPNIPPLAATDLVKLLDDAGIRRAVVLSLGYQLGSTPGPGADGERARVASENDWTAQEAARFPGRLRAFCSINPLKDYALEEVARCGARPQLFGGLKLHLGNSDVDLTNPAHVTQLRRIFRAANEHRLAVVIHLRPSVSKRRPYGAGEARVFLSEVLPEAPDIPVQIAHLGGAGGYDDPAIDQALAVFVQAIADADARVTNLFFDVSGVAGLGQWSDKAALIATRIRQLGIARILYGSDGAADASSSPSARWAAFRQLPLTEAEFTSIAGNVAPYLR
jgi:predicted TIM-barrel fold metal-dependent hydrolase